jgi:hypothetical protein
MRIRLALWLAFSAVAALVGACSRSPPVTVRKEWKLSSYGTDARFIVSIPNGGYVIGGSGVPSGVVGWATRVDQNGQRVWEFFDGPKEKWTTSGPAAHEIGGAMALSDNSILLCGTQESKGRGSPVLIHISATGKLLSEEEIEVQGLDTQRVVRCLLWGDGIAVVVQNVDPSLNRLIKLSAGHEVLWDSTGPYGVDDITIGPDGDLVLLAGRFAAYDIQKIDQTGRIAMTVSVPALGAKFVCLRDASRSLGLLYADSEQTTALAEYDWNLRPQGSPIKAGANIYGRACALGDGSYLVFGGTDRGTTAAIYHLYRNGHFDTVRFAKNSRYFSDVVPVGPPGEFAAVRTTTGLTLEETRPVLTFASMQP